MEPSQRVSPAFEALFGSEPACLVRAPGRVNLIGEHTDYNEGFVLPMAIDRAVWIALRPRRDRRVRVHALDYAETVEFALDGLQQGTGWAEYIKGVAHELQVAGLQACPERRRRVEGWEGVIAGDVPIGAGLSSSAAVEVAAARAFAAVSDFAWHPLRIAKICQKAENDWVGVKCGIMDQVVSAAAMAGHALFLDCRALAYEHIPLPPGVVVAVMDTSTRRGLADSAYNERRAECEAAARFFGAPALRDVSVERLKACPEHRRRVESGKLQEAVLRRARHVITENRRVLEAVAALRAGDAARFGRLLNESHASLRDDFEVTSEALNQIVECALQQPGCLGARITGAGFGGCALALVQTEAVEAFRRAVAECYHQASGLQAAIYVCQASQGAELILL